MPKREPLTFDAGLEQTVEPTMGSDGSLLRAANAEYRIHDNAIWKARGKARFNASPEAGSLDGAVALIPITATPSPIFLVQRGGTWRSSARGTSGSFANAVTGLTGSTVLAKAHLVRHFFIGNGVDRNRVYGPDFLNFGLHSMLAASAAPTISRDAGGGAGFTLTSGAKVYYWVEERVKSGSTILKRSASYLAQVATLTGDGTVDKPVITRTAVRNSDSTHWALFGTSSGGQWPIGAEIAEVAIGTTTIEDTRTDASILPTGALYGVVNVTIADVRQNQPKYGEAPLFDTCDVFEDSLCINDKSNPHLLWFSFSREGHAFPITNTIFMGDGEDQPGQVMLLRRIGSVLVCCLENQVWVVFQLPHPGDKLFQIERVKAKLAGAQGCVGSQAGTRFILGDREMLAYVSHTGVMATDGNGWDLISDDLDWDNLIEPSRIGSTILVDDPRNYRLVMFYTPIGGTANTKAIYLHYHQSHLKSTERGLRLKVTGPVDLVDGATGAFSVLVSGRYETFYSTTGGYLVRMNSGNSQEDASAIAFDVESKETYFAGPSNEAAITRAWLHHRAGAATQTADVTVTTRNEGRGDVTSTRTIPVNRRELTKLMPFSSGASHTIRVQNTDALGTFSINYAVVHQDFEKTEKTRGSKT